MERLLDRSPDDNGRTGAAERPTPTPEQTKSKPATSHRAAQPASTIDGAIIQTKLAVGAADDHYEREADAVAARVVRSLRSQTSRPEQAATQADAGGTAGRINRVQRSAVVGAKGGDLDEDTTQMLRRSRSGGAPLPEPARSKMEGAFGADFSGIRVHAGPRSTELNNRIQAKAFTTGNDIFFRDGVPDATTGSGQELLAHELTHTIQQGAAAPINRSTEVVGPTSSIQRNAVLQRNGGELDEEEIEEEILGWKLQEIPGWSLLQLAQRAEAVLNAWVRDDDVLLDILRGPFEANWFKAKACLAMGQWPLDKVDQPSHEVGIQLMQALVDMRGRVWDAFVKKVQPQILAEVENHRAKTAGFADVLNPLNNADGDGLGANFGLKDSVGSESVTSDIDLSAKGENTEIGLAMINREFPKHFGVTVEPGALLDINVYSSDWMFGGTQMAATAGEYRIKPREEGVLSDGGQKKKDDQNEIWSMVKIRRNMNRLDWEHYKQILLKGLDSDSGELGPVSQVDEMCKKFAVADAEYKSFRNDVKTNVAAMENALDHEEVQQQSAFAENGRDHFADDANEMKVSNRRYEEIVLQVKEMRLRIKMLQAVDGLRPLDIEPLLLQMHNEIARGLTYANEVYATQGAVLHTVYGNQGAGKKLTELQNEKDPEKNDAAKALAGGAITSVKYDLTKEMYLQSLNENVGDTLHSLKHNAGDPQYAVYRAGKYISRLCDAAKELVGVDVAGQISGYVDLDKIGKDSVREKGEAAGEDPDAVHRDESAFSSFTARDLPLVKEKAIVLGARAAAIYKKSKA
ncbi:MAG: hypothetical protein ACI9N0_001207 [Ilumatobacter sp.]